MKVLNSYGKEYYEAGMVTGKQEAVTTDVRYVMGGSVLWERKKQQ